MVYQLFEQTIFKYIIQNNYAALSGMYSVIINLVSGTPEIDQNAFRMVYLPGRC